MDGLATGGFLRHFAHLPDPRAANTVHGLSDMLVIAVCAILSGAQSWVDVESFGKAKQAWLATFLPLPAGIPSHDTFGRLFARLSPDAFERCFTTWTSSLRGQQLRHVAIDGKSIRNSFEHAWDQSGMAHLVSAFVAEQQLSFAQLALPGGRGSELEAMRRLLELVELDVGTVVTIDAAGCQRDLAAQIFEQHAEYVLAVKSNQPTLLAKVQTLLDEAVLSGGQDLPHGYSESVEGDHGRIETRRVWVTDQVQHLGETLVDQWPGLASVALVESVREAVNGAGEAVRSVTRRYYISSLPGRDAVQIGKLIRDHWGIENQLHWQLDVTFAEDQRRVRKDYSAENFSRLCRIALNLLKTEKTAKVGVQGKRLKAAWNEAYLIKLLTG